MDRSMLDFQNMIDNTEEFMEKEIEQLPIRLAENNYLTKSGWPIENYSKKSGWPIKRIYLNKSGCPIENYSKKSGWPINKLFKQIKLANKLIYLNKSGWPIKNYSKKSDCKIAGFP